jgi:hypothetical protein
MQPSRPLLNTWLWTVGAVSGLVWGLLVLVCASLGPAQYVPRLLSSYHLEHFLAFYALGLLAAAALPRLRLIYLGLALVAIAAGLELVRTVIPPHQLAAAPDFVADVGGVFAALLPLLVGRFRGLVLQERPDPPELRPDLSPWGSMGQVESPD